ncbi:MAG TPA: exodeoxyribonuclease VII small subunit [Parachlamydiaceae bacterium]|nr:exodeoxyribonuclease VII small subunit [Parachlamydiaceae bacterium]
MQPIDTPTPSELTFESAFARLEEILERMNSGTISLDESLKLYEEADRLILTCSKRLTDAERKIEILVKNRNGELALGADQKPLVQDFNIPSSGSNTKQQRETF